MIVTLLPHSAIAADPQVLVSGGDSLSIWIRIDWPDPLPAFVQERLEHGIPATIGVRVELWRIRTAWFDSHIATADAELKIVRDPWRGSFLLVDGDSTRAVNGLHSLIDNLSQWTLQLPIERGWNGTDSEFRVEAVCYVQPLTVDDAAEVENWLRGEIRGFGAGILGLPRGLFGIIRDLSGLGERRSRSTSRRFRLSVLPSGRVRVLLAGTARGATSEDAGGR